MSGEIADPARARRCNNFMCGATLTGVEPAVSASVSLPFPKD